MHHRDQQITGSIHTASTRWAAGKVRRALVVILVVVSVVSGLTASAASGSPTAAPSPTSASTPQPRTAALTTAGGYRLVASDGGIFTFGSSRFFGSTGSMALNRPIVGSASTADGGGYWLVAADGGIFTFGDASFYGSTGGERLQQPIVGMAATPDGKGYWLVAADGGIFTFGDAAFHGSTGAERLQRPIVGMATTADGRGYWLVASDGGIFTFGDVGFYGSTGSMALTKPVVGMAPTPDGNGYWLVAADGGIFTFGDAAFYGSTGGEHLNRPIIGMTVSTSTALTRSDVTSATEVVYGSGGSFGALGTTSALPGGQSVVTDGVPGWGFLPGQAVMGAALGPDGSIVMGGEPQTGNQGEATADTMSASIFNPVANSFQNVVIPTSTGETAVNESGRLTGGADISTLTAVPAKNGDIGFMSSYPYRGWDTSTVGQYPTLGYLAPTGNGTYGYVGGYTANQLEATAPASNACSTSLSPVADCDGPAAMAILPKSGDIVVAQYYSHVAAGQDSGSLMVLSPGGLILASYAYPNVDGGAVGAYPREIDVDPTSTAGHERFVVVFDTMSAVGQSTFPMQTFDFDASAADASNGTTGTITPESAPILPGQTVNGQTAYFETAHFDLQGDLWAAESVTSSTPGVNAISGGNIIEYSAASVRGRLAGGACAALANWASTQWDEPCAPDQTFTAAAGEGDVYSVNLDTASGALYFATLSGILIPIRPTGTNSWSVGPLFDFGLNELADRNANLILPRQGALDPASGYLWLPVEHWESSAACNASGDTCQSAPGQLDQWLMRINVNQLG